MGVPTRAGSCVIFAAARRAAGQLAAMALVGMVTSGVAAAQDTHLLVISGVPGSPEYASKFSEWATTIVESAKTLGVATGHVHYLADKNATRDAVNKAFADLAAATSAEDQVFIVLVGHGSFNGREGSFNLVGPDLSAADYALLLDRLPAQRIVFVNTASSSGAFLEPLAGPGRTIVTATRTGGERNETRFPEFFVEALSGEAADRDRNGRVSILEAFDFANSRVEAAYQQTGHIPTEHPTLDDGTDGKLAATLYLAPPRSRSAEMANADPALRTLVEERDALEEQINQHRLRKGAMEAAAYEAELERLLTELALKTRAIRDFEAKK